MYFHGINDKYIRCLFLLTLIQPIWYPVEHGGRSRAGDSDDLAFAVPVHFVVQVVFVHEHEPAARRRPFGSLDVNLFTIVHRFRHVRQRHSISANEIESRTVRVYGIIR